MSVELLTSGMGVGGVLVRVATPGGATLRSFAGQAEVDGGVWVRGLEAEGRACELRLTNGTHGDGRPLLVGDWLPVGVEARLPHGGWIADGAVGVAATRAAA